jgi:hypothetical protein
MRLKLEELGFQAFVIDLIDGPEPVLNYLCSSAYLHTIVSGTAVALPALLT